jgi:hypothetical protein
MRACPTPTPTETITTITALCRRALRSRRAILRALHCFTLAVHIGCIVCAFCRSLLLLRGGLIRRGLLRRLREYRNQKRREHKSRKESVDMRHFSFLLVKRSSGDHRASESGRNHTPYDVRPDCTPHSPTPAELCRKRRHVPKYRQREFHLRLLNASDQRDLASVWRVHCR